MARSIIQDQTTQLQLGIGTQQIQKQMHRLDPCSLEVVWRIQQLRGRWSWPRLPPVSRCTHLSQSRPPRTWRPVSGHGGRMQLEPRPHETSGSRKADTEQQRSEVECFIPQIDLEHKKVDMARQRGRVEGLLALERLHTGGQVRKTPGWPRSWANFSLL